MQKLWLQAVYIQLALVCARYKFVKKIIGTAAERITEFEYDQYGRLILLRQVGDARTPEAITRWTSYDNYGNPLIQIDPEGVETRFTWDVMGNLLTYRDGRQNTWSWTYDAAGNLLTETDPLNHGTIYSYDKVGNLLTITDALGIVQMSFSYNARDSITNAYSQTYVYNDQNQLIEAKDENNKISRIAYDASGRPTTVTDAVGNVISFDWGKNNSHLFGLSEIHYPTFSERYSYDKRYRITGIERYAGESVLQTVGYRYDDEGNLTEIIDPANRSSKKFYDELNRLVSMQDPANNFVSLVYDDRDNIRSVTNELNTLIREFTYSLRNEQEQVAWPNGSTFTSQWDANGNLETYTDAKGQIHRHTWDAANRLSETRYFENIGALNAEPPNPLKTVTYAYNNADSLTGYNDGVTSATYSYDNMQRNTGATVNYGPFTRSHSYSFNTVGKKASLTNPDGSVNQFFYDNAQRLNRINLVGEGSVTINSYKWFAVEKVTLPGGTTREFTYDPLMRIKTIDVKDPAQNSVLNYRYDYDVVGNITSKQTEHGNYNYTYDELDRLLTTSNPDFGAQYGGNGAFTEIFTYDTTGNRKTSVETEGEWLYNSTSQLTQIGADGPTYIYDANGNVETKTENGLIETYVYNIENRLIELRDNDNDVIATYTYDAAGRRLSKTTSEGTRYFYYADEGLIAEFDATGQTIQSYGYTPHSLWGTDPVFAKNSSNSYAYYLSDHLGTPQQLIQGNGAMVWSARYRVFGLASLNQANSWISNLRFPGQYEDTESGSHYNYFRNYDPSLGRYIASDPIGMYGGLNTYSYVFSNPMIYSDFQGLLVHIVFDKTKGTVTVTDIDTGRSVTADAFSGSTGNTDPAPNGTYTITNDPSGKAHYYGLMYHDDIVDDELQDHLTDKGKPRNGIRFHPGPVSLGCVTVPSQRRDDSTDAWREIEDILKNTKKGPPFKYNEDGYLTNYGTMEVKGDGHGSVPPSADFSPPVINIPPPIIEFDGGI